MPRTILVVEDNPQAVAVISAAVEAAGCAVLSTDKAETAKRLFDREKPELAVLDIHLKEGDGYEVCRHIRQHPQRGTTPVIMLTGDAELEAKAEGFAAGADNYLTKPLDAKELVLWIQALLRRAGKDWSAAQTVTAGELSVNPQTREVRVEGELVRGLADKEFRLLWELAKAKPGVLTRDELTDKLWDGMRGSNTVEVHVNRLRNRLGPKGAIHVVTVRGVGYRLE